MWLLSSSAGRETGRREGECWGEGGFVGGPWAGCSSECRGQMVTRVDVTPGSRQDHSGVEQPAAQGFCPRKWNLGGKTKPGDYWVWGQGLFVEGGACSFPPPAVQGREPAEGQGEGRSQPLHSSGFGLAAAAHLFFYKCLELGQATRWWIDACARRFCFAEPQMQTNLTHS